MSVELHYTQMNHRDVLVVDDDPATRVLLETLICRAGLTVHTAADGEEAMKALDDWHVDAIITDLFMPRINGMDLLESVDRDHRELLPKVIVLSAAPESLLKNAQTKYPIWCAMRKPADISDLLENVLNCVVHA